MTAATALPVLVPGPDMERASAARHMAKVVLPGPIGELLYRELCAWIDWAHRFDKAGRGMALVADIEARHRAMVLARTYG